MSILSSEAFNRVVGIVAARAEHPEAFEQFLAEDAEGAQSWRRWTQQQETVGGYWKSALTRTLVEHWTKWPPGRKLRGRRTYMSQAGARVYPVAFALAEIQRLAQGGTSETDPALVAKAGDEGKLVGMYPLLAVIAETLNTSAKGGAEIPVAMITKAVEELEVIQGSLGKGPLATHSIGLSLVPSLATGLAREGMLDAQALADCFQTAYDQRWHTKPKTKTARGAFVDGIRARAITQGDEGLLTVLAAGSDGSLRAVAGASERTNDRVYERLLFDNSFSVLRHVVANRKFDDKKAYAMIEKDLPMQLASVMLHGRVHMGVRVLACRKAIANPGVDPYKIYSFLVENRNDESVPMALWRDFLNTLQGRLKALEEAGQDDAAGRVRERLERVSRDFVVKILTPYVAAATNIAKVQTTAEERVARGGSSALSYYERRILNENKTFMTANEFLRDPAVLDFIIQGATSVEMLKTILEGVKVAKLPVSKMLIVHIMKHADIEVRRLGLTMLPQHADADVERMAQELESDIAREYARLDENVRTLVVPDYEAIDAEPRVVSRMQYHFASARKLPASILVEAFVEAAKTDPTKIPDVFRKLTLEAEARTAVAGVGVGR